MDISRNGKPNLVLHNVDEVFSAEEKEILVSRASGRDWANLLELSKNEILDKYSTTPEFEPTWFVSNLIESAEFVKKL